jgi:DNA polymerase-3 subunit beta
VKLVASAGALAAAAKAAAGAIDDKAAKRNPILGALLIDATEMDCRFTGTDLDAAIVVSATAAIAKVGRAAASGEALVKLFAGMATDAEVTIETVASGLQIKAASRARYRLPTLPPENFPVAPATTSTVEITLSRDEARRLFASTRFCMNTEGTRHYLRGSFLHLDTDGRLCAIATDGYRLAYMASTIIPAPSTLPANGENTGIIIPAKTIILLNKLKAKQIALRADPKVLTIRADDLQITSKLIDGIYPDYKRIIPPESHNTATLEREALLGALKRLNAARNAARSDVNMTLTWKNGSNARLAIADGEIAEDVVAATTTGAAQITLAIPQMLIVTEEVEAKTLQLGVAGKSDPMRIAAGDLLAVLAPCVR